MGMAIAPICPNVTFTNRCGCDLNEGCNKPAPARAVPAVPGFARAYTITFDGDTLWLECDHCSAPVKPVEAGDSLEDIVTRARDHERVCAATRATPVQPTA